MHPCTDFAKFYVFSGFYVFSELRKQTSKTKPLWQVFHSAVIGPKILTSKSGRKTWLQAWSANRSKRYAKPPKA